VLLIGVAGSAHQAWSANLFTTASDMFPQRAVARLVGMGGMAGSASGIAFPLLVGRLLDRFQAAGNATGGYAIVFIVCGLAYLVAFAIGQLLAPSFEPVSFGEGEKG
jgi:MFS transporter, ACS family, hexuronate transporter